ncbi:acylneuraminate cytidylyltransferase [Enterobacteriaceae bacterium RIT711]|nr:acylneuraminate cytidylyltransferase [Enterobacteriaceae bacterium RIT711]
MPLSKIAIIPARSGSKGLPNKNILMLLDRPLIAYTIEAAIESGIFSRVILTTDSLEYKYIAEQYGAEVIMRSEELASDTATTFMVIDDVLNKVDNYDYFVLLQPTSPFRNSEHIKQAANLFEQKNPAKFLVSVAESCKSSDLVKPIDDSLSLEHFDLDFSQYRRQNHKEYSPNGAIFMGYADAYRMRKHFFGADSIAYIMDKESSIDIDDRLDFEFAITIQTKKNKEKILREKIISRINEKICDINTFAPITLIGHSIFDFWDINNLGDKEVNNLGVAGISSEECYKLLFENGLVKTIGDTVLLLAGTNDIVIQNWTAEFTIYWSSKLIEVVHTLNPHAQIYFLAVPPVFGRIERDNNVICNLNKSLKNSIGKYNFVTWVPLSSSFYDQFGNLRRDFTCDGLHFTSKAYVQLEQDILSLLS